MLSISELYPGVAYDPFTGFFYRLCKNKQIIRRLIPDENNSITYSCALTNKIVKKKASTLAWEIFNNTRLQKNLCVFARDMQESNLELVNIGVIPKEEYKKLRDSFWNLHNLKIIPHKDVAYSFVVIFRRGGKSCRLVAQDIIHAQKIKKRILHKAMKILTRYIVSK